MRQMPSAHDCMSTIDLILADDWELRGDGSGDIRTIQFANLRTLTHLYEDVGLRGSFNPEVMQQLYHLRFAGQHPELLEVAHEWAELVRTIYQRGHDVSFRAGTWALVPSERVL